MAPQNPASGGSPDPIRELLDEKTLADEITKAIEGNDCPREKDLLAYVQKELEEPERIEVKSHLVFCTRCQAKVKQMEEEPGAKAQGDARSAAGGRESGTASTSPRRRRTSPRKRFSAAALALVLAGGIYLILVRSLSDFPYSVMIVEAAGLAPGEEQLIYEVHTAKPIYLIEITVDGNGLIAARIPAGDGSGKYSDGDRVPLALRARGEIDVYLVPCATSEGYPNRVLSELLKFIRTESSVSRENQRRGIEMALDFYQLRFIHKIHRLKSPR